MLPEDRADVLYFRYDGGEVTINGPSMLVRKSIGEHVSVAANYYIDMVSSASIDVQTSASPYDDERTQSSLAVDFLHGKSTYSIGYVNSDESDYKAKTMFAGGQPRHVRRPDHRLVLVQERQERRVPEHQDRRHQAERSQFQ